MDDILRAERISGGYYNAPVIKDVTLNIARGEFVGIIGPNGSGKSTLLKLLSRVLVPVSGTILFEGKPAGKMLLGEFARRVAFVSQNTFINFPFTVHEVVMMGRMPHLGRLQAESSKDMSIAEEALKLTDTIHLKDKEINELSAGERQRVIIARALAQEPSLLFLDEPTAHLDIAHQVHTLDLLRRLNRQRSLSVVIVLHDLNLAALYCDRIVMLNEGTIFCDGLPSHVLTYQNIESVYKTVVVVKEDTISHRPCVV